MSATNATDPIEVCLASATAGALLRRPLDELTNQTVALADLFDGNVSGLIDQLAEAPDWVRRFELLSAALTARLSDAPVLAGEVR